MQILNNHLTFNTKKIRFNGKSSHTPAVTSTVEYINLNDFIRTDADTAKAFGLKKSLKDTKAKIFIISNTHTSKGKFNKGSKPTCILMPEPYDYYSSTLVLTPILRQADRRFDSTHTITEDDLAAMAEHVTRQFNGQCSKLKIKFNTQNADHITIRKTLNSNSNKSYIQTVSKYTSTEISYIIFLEELLKNQKKK